MVSGLCVQLVFWRLYSTWYVNAVLFRACYWNFRAGVRRRYEVDDEVAPRVSRGLCSYFYSVDDVARDVHVGSTVVEDVQYAWTRRFAVYPVGIAAVGSSAAGLWHVSVRVFYHEVGSSVHAPLG